MCIVYNSGLTDINERIIFRGERTDLFICRRCPPGENVYVGARKRSNLLGVPVRPNLVQVTFVTSVCRPVYAEII